MSRAQASDGRPTLLVRLKSPAPRSLLPAARAGASYAATIALLAGAILYLTPLLQNAVLGWLYN